MTMREHDRGDRRGHGLGLEDEPGRRRLALGEHDREQDEHADRADVDEDLGAGHERRADEDVEPGEGPEADDHRQAAADDVASSSRRGARTRASSRRTS